MGIVNLHEWNPDAFKLLLSLLLGSFIGLEREVSDKPAGLRTNILICLGATLFTVASLKVFKVADAHIPAQIIAGIGFLGAGSIMREGEHVTGLTTAATIWIMAAIGMTVGFGEYILASMVAALVLFVQLAFTKLDILIDDWRMRHNFRIISKMDHKSISVIRDIFREARVRVMRQKLMKKNNLYYSEWYTTGGREGQERAMKLLLDSSEVIEVIY